MCKLDCIFLPAAGHPVLGCSCRRAGFCLKGSFGPARPVASTPKRVLRTKQGDVVGCAAEALPAADTAEAEQGQTQRPRPADETGSCVWRSAPIFTRAHCRPLGKLAKRKRTAVCFLRGRDDARSKSRAPQPGAGRVGSLALCRSALNTLFLFPFPLRWGQRAREGVSTPPP